MAQLLNVSRQRVCGPLLAARPTDCQSFKYKCRFSDVVPAPNRWSDDAPPPERQRRTCHWGFFDAARKPVLTIGSGNRVTADTLTGAPAYIPKSGFYVLVELAEVHARAERFEGGPHILTSPIAVNGAKPGQVLEVRILNVKLRRDWGFNLIRPRDYDRRFGQGA